MSNFQRTRSKVWWGDSPPGIGSPDAQPVEWNRSNKPDEDQDWEPQLPHWIANVPDQEKSNISHHVSPPNNPPNQWPLRHGSPGSHKSQDSGFSDSDSSPPPSQYYQSPQNDTKATNKSSSSSDSNNNENITVKQVIDFQNTSHSKDVVDNSKMSDNNNNSNGIPTPKPRLRSSSVIQTPYDLQKYYEVHQDEEHMALLKDTPEEIVTVTSQEKVQSSVDTLNIQDTLRSSLKQNNCIDVNVTSIIVEEVPVNVANYENISINAKISDAKDVLPNNNGIISPSKKYPIKKQFISSHDSDNTKVIKVAKVKDLETSKNVSDDSLEYIKLSDNNEIAVNNLPRIRTPISNVLYVPTERTSTKRTNYRRSMSHEDETPISKTTDFQRNRLNKSLNLEGQKLDQQILNIQDGCRSLEFIAEDVPSAVEEQIHVPNKAILGKNIKDSLNLRPIKKFGPKARQRNVIAADKVKNQKSTFKIFSSNREKPGVVDTHAGGILDGGRVPSLGLPRSADYDQWVIVGYPAQERLIPSHTERSVDEETISTPKNRRISPPPQFKDTKIPYKVNVKNKDLTHVSKREKIKDDDPYFLDLQMNLACTSTPKMLTPSIFMNDITPRSSAKSSRRTNLLESFNRVVLNDEDELLYRERDVDQTTLERICYNKAEPVQYWLSDLAASCDNECMTTLQSKPLGAEVKVLVSAGSATITGNIKKVQTHGQIIIHQYSDVIRKFEENSISEEQICLLVANINEFVLAHSITLNIKPPGESPERWDKIKKSLHIYLQKLIDIGEDIKIELNESNPEWKVVNKHLEKLIHIFTETTKAVLVQQMKTLVSIIEEPPSDMILKSTLTSIGHLAILSEDKDSSLHELCSTMMKSITELPFVDCGIPRALLTAIIENNKSSVKALSLRALATVCVTGDAVKQFEEGGGIEILSDILSDASNPEPQMREAITVLTQITAPWLRGHYDMTQLDIYLDSIINHITGILYRTECCQLLLLCTACLVNLVRELELERREETRRSDIVETLTRHRTVERLLEAIKRKGPNISVFLQEQAASLLASLSHIPRCILLLSRIPTVLLALVCFTRGSTDHTRRAAELRAQARLHCHATDALSRLCVIPEISGLIVDLEGVSHLIRMVREQKTRPQLEVNPDQTLIHCLKTLRTIYKNKPQAFDDYRKDAEEMVRPHLMESLMLFSAKQESYV